MNRLKNHIPGLSGTFQGLEYETLPNGETIYDKINVGKLPRDFFSELKIAEEVQPGKIYQAWLEHFKGLGGRLLTTYLLWAGFTLMIYVAIAFLMSPSAVTSSPPTMIEKLLTAPYTIEKGRIEAEHAKASEPAKSVLARTGAFIEKTAKLADHLDKIRKAGEGAYTLAATVTPILVTFGQKLLT